MPPMLVGMPVSNVSPSDLAVAPSWARAMSALFSVTARAPDLGPLACTPLHPPGATAAKKMQAAHVDIVHLVPWKSAARRHRQFRELHRRPGQGADPARHSGA